MFDTEENYDRWAAEVKNKRDKFATFIPSDDIMIKLLQEEIAAGRATYINATERGFNPKIASLQTSQENINRTDKSQELKIPFTSKELAERKQESDRRKQKFTAMKAHILNPESGKPLKNEKDKINPFIRNYMEQLQSK